MKGRFSKKAQMHARQSRARTEKMLEGAARRSGPVKISYLPGFEPPHTNRTKFPFEATINGERYLVYQQAGEIVFEELEEETPYAIDEDPPEWWEIYEQPEGEEFYR